MPYKNRDLCFKADSLLYSAHLCTLQKSTNHYQSHKTQVDKGNQQKPTNRIMVAEEGLEPPTQGL